MSDFSQKYVNSLRSEFYGLVTDLPSRLDSITNGRVVPEIGDIAIGAARELRGAVLFFDIRGFTMRTGSPDTESLKNTLYMINCVIPMITRLVNEHGGYIEKNTGDGIMAIIGAEAGKTDEMASMDALEIALKSFYSIEHIINPHLVDCGIQPVQARIGIDLGPILLARVGLPNGSAGQDRNFLTAIGPAANFACKLQGMAGTNEIWVGDLIRNGAPPEWHHYFMQKDLEPKFNWVYVGTNNPYPIWHFDTFRGHPLE